MADKDTTRYNIGKLMMNAGLLLLMAVILAGGAYIAVMPLFTDMPLLLSFIGVGVIAVTLIFSGTILRDAG